jgi:hypothetical protein
MATQFQPPPTYADPMDYDEQTKRGTFSPLWLKWFLALAYFVSVTGASNPVILSQSQAGQVLVGTPSGAAQWSATINNPSGTATFSAVNASGTSTLGAATMTPTKLGYRSGVGGAVTQSTSRTTGVTLNKPCGAITLFSEAGGTTWKTFTLTSSAIEATDTILVHQSSGANLYQAIVTNVAAGSCNISVSAVSGTAIEAPVLQFAVYKAVNA